MCVLYEPLRLSRTIDRAPRLGANRRHLRQVKGDVGAASSIQGPDPAGEASEAAAASTSADLQGRIGRLVKKVEGRPQAQRFIPPT